MPSSNQGYMRNDFSKIFVLSHQKCATTSTGLFLTQHGISCAGADGHWNRIWSMWALNREWERIFQSNRFRSHVAFEDDPWWMNGAVDILLDTFPDGLYVLIERDPDEWFSSMLAHSQEIGLGFSMIHMMEYQRAEEYANYLLENRQVIRNEGAFSLTEDDRMHYTSIYRKRLNAKLQAFQQRGLMDRLCHVRLDNPNKWSIIGNHLGIDVQKGCDIRTNTRQARLSRPFSVMTKLKASLKALSLVWKSE